MMDTTHPLAAQLLGSAVRERPQLEPVYREQPPAFFDELERELQAMERTEQRTLESLLKDLELFNTVSNELENDAWYDQPAAFVSMHLDFLMLGFSRRRLARLIDQARRSAPVTHFCDVGSGCGRLAKLLLQGHPGWRAELVDKSGAATAYAQRYLSAHGLSSRAHAATGDLLALPFADGELDLIIAAEVLEHTTDAERAASELLRVLRPQGLLLISLPIDLDIKMHPVVFESEQHIVAFFERFPLRVVERDVVRPTKLDAISDVFPSFRGCLHATFEKR